MCCKTIKNDFTFRCYTENPKNINDNIHIVPLGNYGLEAWWWKLSLFEDFNNSTNIFFDLDVVIQKEISDLKNIADNNLKLIKAYWKMDYDIRKLDHNINSSVMIWKNDLRYIWNHFMQDPEYYMIKYRGIDGYLYFEHNDSLSYLPRKIVYSRQFGIDEINSGNKELYKVESYPICIFNGWRKDTNMIGDEYKLDDDGYKGFEHYWH